MKRFLPDSNIFIRASKGFEPELAFVNKQIEKNELIISVVAIGEFYAKATESEKQMFDNLIARFGVLGIDEVAAKLAGDYRSEYLKKSKRVYLLDCFLAAQAKINNLTLVTNDATDFPMRDIKVVKP